MSVISILLMKYVLISNDDCARTKGAGSGGRFSPVGDVTVGDGGLSLGGRWVILEICMN